MVSASRSGRVLVWVILLAIAASLPMFWQGEPGELVEPESDPRAAAPETAETTTRQTMGSQLDAEPASSGRSERRRGLGLQGRVLDALGSPLLGCRVILDPKSSPVFSFQAMESQVAEAEARSDASGRFHLQASASGPYVLTLVHPDYPPTVVQSDLQLDPDRTKRLGDLQLHSEIGLIVIVRADAGLPVPGAVLNLSPVLENPELPTSSQRAMRRVALSDQAGRALFYGVAPGPYLLRAEAAGLATVEHSHLQQQRLARPPQIRIDLPRGEVLRGRVSDADGKPVMGARVFLQAHDQLEASATTSADGGLFRLGGLKSGSYTVRVESPWLGSLERPELEVPSSASLLEFRFPAGMSLAGNVLRAADRSPVAAAEIRLLAPAAWGQLAVTERSRQARSDQQGAFRIQSIPAGRYRIEVESKGLFPASLSIDIDQPNQPLKVQLQEAFRLSGRLVDLSGKGLSGGQIEVIDASYNGSQFSEFKLQALGRDRTRLLFHSEPNGRFLSNALGSGDFRLRLSARDKASMLSPAFRANAGVSLDLGNLPLSPASTLQGRALLAIGQPAARAVVCIDPVGDSEPPKISHQVRADETGKFRIEGIEAGSYDLFYYYPEEQRPGPAVDSHTRSLLRIDIRAGALEHQDLVLR